MVDAKKYQLMIGALMHLARATRPDVAHIASKLLQYNRTPRKIHLTAAKRVYRYLKGTIDYKLIYSRNVGPLTISTDASWDSTEDSKSFSGLTVKLGDCLVHWESKKQNVVALSTLDAELMALCEGIKEFKWWTSLLTEIGLKDYIILPIKIYTDSKAVIDTCNQTGYNAKTKHICRKLHFAKEEVTKGNVKLIFTPTDKMEADILTKCLSEVKLLKGIQLLGLLQK